MQSLGQKLLIATVSGGAAALLAWAALGARPDADLPTVVMADNTLAWSELLKEREREVPAPIELERGEPELTAGEVSVPEDTTPAPYPPPLVRELVTEKRALRMYAVLRRKGTLLRYQPEAHLWGLPSRSNRRPFAEYPAGRFLVQTNSLGLRKDVEVRAQAPDLRVLVTGDSHTAGVVPNSESYANVLEVLLSQRDPTRSFEVLNAGVGGTSLYHYLGVLEFLEAELRPQVLVVGVYGGNDFVGVMSLYRYYHRRPPPTFGPHGGQRLSELPGTGVVGQMLSQTAYFLDNPGDVALAREAVDSITVELERHCRESGIDLIFVYIPPVVSVQHERYEHLLEEPLATLDITLEQLQEVNEYAAHWLEFVEQRGLTCIDMSPLFRASQEDCYWFADLHINTHGHRLIAEALAPVIADL